MNLVNRVFLMVLCAYVTIFPAQLLPQEELPEEATPRALTIDDFFAIKQVRDPQISPDGQWLAYLVRASDIKKRQIRNPTLDETHVRRRSHSNDGGGVFGQPAALESGWQVFVISFEPQ